MGNVNRFFGIIGSSLVDLMLVREDDGTLEFRTPAGVAPDFDPTTAQFVGANTVSRVMRDSGTFRLIGGVGSANAFREALTKGTTWRAERGFMTIEDMANHSAYGKGWTLDEIIASYTD